MLVRSAALVALLLASPAHAAENLDAALSELASEVMSYFQSGAPQKIAVATMVHGDGTCSDLTERASDRFQGALFRLTKDSPISIIDRRSLSAIFREQQLVEDGTISPTGAARIAAVEQVDAIVTSKMTQYGDDLELAVSMLNATSGTVIGFADASFRLTSRDEDMLATRNLARCGFAAGPGGATAQSGGTPGVSGRTGVETRPAEADGAVFTSDLFSAEVVSLFYARTTGNLTVTLRLSNTSEEPLDISLNPTTVNIQDNAGGVLTVGGGFAGLATCAEYRYCHRSRQGAVTTLAAGTRAQLNFSATGQPELEDLSVTLTFELYLTADPEGETSSKIVSVGFFDLVPVAR